VDNAIAKQLVRAVCNGTGFPFATMFCDYFLSQRMSIAFNFNLGGLIFSQPADPLGPQRRAPALHGVLTLQTKPNQRLKQHA